MPAPSAPRPAGCPPLPVVSGLAAQCEEVWPSLLAVLTRLERCGLQWVARPGLTVGPIEADGGPAVLQRLPVSLLAGAVSVPRLVVAPLLHRGDFRPRPLPLHLRMSPSLEMRTQ